MFHSRRMERKIHQRSLRLIYPSDSELTFKKLLDENKTLSIHQKKTYKYEPLKYSKQS